jgi:hypothetical protein
VVSAASPEEYFVSPVKIAAKLFGKVIGGSSSSREFNTLIYALGIIWLRQLSRSKVKR